MVRIEINQEYTQILEISGYGHNPLFPLLAADCAYDYTMDDAREYKSVKSVD